MMRRPVFWALIAIVVAAVVILVSSSWPPDPEELFDFEGPRLVVLIALLVVLLGSLIVERPAWREVGRAILFWGGLAVVLVGVYAFRFELETFGKRTLAALIPGMAVESSEGAGTVMIVRADDGHFHVTARVDGKADIRLLVDTGASSIVLSHDDARAAGINVDRLAFSVPVSTANGSALVAPVTLSSVAVGGDVAVRNTPAFVAAKGALKTSLLGMSFLSTLSSWEMRGDQLILRP